MTAAEALGHLSNLPMALSTFTCTADINLYLEAVKTGATPHQIAAQFNLGAMAGKAEHLITTAYARAFEDKLTRAKSAGLFSQYAERALQEFWRLVRAVANEQDWAPMAQQKPRCAPGPAPVAASTGSTTDAAAHSAPPGAAQDDCCGGEPAAAAPVTPPPPPTRPARATPRRAAKTKAAARKAPVVHRCSRCNLPIAGAGHLPGLQTGLDRRLAAATGYCPVKGAWSTKKDVLPFCQKVTGTGAERKAPRGKARWECDCTGCLPKKRAAHAALSSRPGFDDWVKDNGVAKEVAAVAARYTAVAPPIGAAAAAVIPPIGAAATATAAAPAPARPGPPPARSASSPHHRSSQAANESL